MGARKRAPDDEHNKRHGWKRVLHALRTDDTRFIVYAFLFYIVLSVIGIVMDISPHEFLMILRAL